MGHIGGVHAGRRRLRSYLGRDKLCLLLALVLALAPLPAAYGAGAGEAQADAAAPAAAAQGEGADSPGAAGYAAADGQQDPAESAVTGDGGADGDAQPVEAAGQGASVEDGDWQQADGGSATAAEDGAPAAGDAVAAGACDEAAEASAESATSASKTSANAASRQVAALSQASSQSAASAGDLSTSASMASSAVISSVSGSISLLVIVAGFLGDGSGAGAVPYDDEYDWASAIFSSATGVSAYYDAMSDGAFTFLPASETSAYGADGNTNVADAQDDGIVHVSLPEAHGNWGDDFDTSMLGTFKRILQAASEYVDFAAYDADGDGTLDSDELAIAFVIAGYDSSSSVNPLPSGSYALWSHSWDFSSADGGLPVLDGVTVSDYIAMGEKMGENGDSGFAAVQNPLSTIVHELGHVLGLPDLYDSGDEGYSDYSVDDLSLMGTGNWARVTDDDGETEYVPTALDAWSRYRLGWVTPTVVTEGGVYRVSAEGSDDGYTVLLIPTGRQGEYYLIENRTFSGWDSGLAEDYGDYASGGLVIWHIDDGVVDACLLANDVNGAGHRPGVMPLFAEADDDSGSYSLAWRNSYPDLAYPFWTRGMFQELFPGATMLELPLYGTGASADDMDARVLSGIRIQFLSGPGSTMEIRILMPGEAADEDSQVAKQAADKADDAAASADSPAGEIAAAAEAIPATGDALPLWTLAALAIAAIAGVIASRHRA